MPLPTISDVQPVDPILTNMLLGYLQSDTRFVASKVFPTVPVQTDSGTYFIVDKKYFALDSLQIRAPGASFADVRFGLSSTTYTTIQYAGEYKLPDEIRANSQVPMELEQIALRRLALTSLIRKERAFAADFMTTGVWGTDNTTATDWDDFQSGDPVTDILTAKRTISNSTGIEPNSLVLGFIVHQALISHPDIIDRLKYVQAATQGSLEAAIGAVLGVDMYMVSKASYNSANEAQTATMAAIVDDDALLCYVEPGANMLTVCSGKTFVWGGGGGAGSIYRQRDGMTHSDVIQHKEQWDQKAVATDTGYFWSDIV